MNKLLLGSVLALASMATGCVIEGSGGYYDEDVEVASISARWSLRNMVDGATTACPQGFDTVQLIAQAIDANGDPVFEPAIDLFDCNARGGLVTDLVPDVYQVWMEVRSRDLDRLYAQSLSQILDLRAEDQRFDTEVLNDGGYFQLSWDLVGKASNRPVQCSQAGGISAIESISTSVADGTRSYEDTFVCEDGFAVSGGLLEGAYTIAIDALVGEKSVGKATTLTTKVIAGQNQVTDLGTLVIPIDGL